MKFLSFQGVYNALLKYHVLNYSSSEHFEGIISCKRKGAQWFRVMLFNASAIILSLGLIFTAPCIFAEIPMCSGPNNLLSLSDRPSIASSICTVEKSSLIVESGIERHKVPDNIQYLIFPTLEVRYGLSELSELDILPSTYYRDKPQLASGFGITSIGYRRIGYYDADQVFTFFGLINLPSGNRVWGSRKGGFHLQGIYSHNLPLNLGFTMQFDVSLLSDPPDIGGKSFYSFNPIGLISWSPIDPIQIYLEYYSQSKTTSFSGWGSNADIGLMILLNKNLMVDFSYGHRISGALSDLKHYVGCGMVFRIN